MFGRTKDATRNTETSPRLDGRLGESGRDEAFEPVLDERALPLQPLANDELEAKGFNPKVARAAAETRAPRLSAPLHTGHLHDQRPESRPDTRKRTDEDKTLTVGRDISLHGEIADCQKVHVEGNVEGTLTACRLLVITETGAFNGSAEIGAAEISGRFEGELSCSGRLYIRAGGVVSGVIRYGQLEIELGGEIRGDIASAAFAAEREQGSDARREPVSEIGSKSALSY